MVTADTLAAQGASLRQIMPTTPLLQIIAKTLGSVGSANGGPAPSLTRDQWLAATSDLQGVAESDLLAFIADQLARIFLQGGQPGLAVTGDEISLSATQATLSGNNTSVIGEASLSIADPQCVLGTAAAGSPLRLIDGNGLCEYGRVGEAWQTVNFSTLTASRNVANADCGATLLYTGATAITLTIPSGLVSGLKFRVVQGGAGKVTIAGSGVTVNGKNGHLSTGGAWHPIDVVQIAASQFLVYGDNAA
jgi:hypothetical protein